MTHNDLNPGDTITLTGCNGTYTVIGLLDGYRGIKVQPEILRDDPVWIDISEVTGKVAA